MLVFREETKPYNRVVSKMLQILPAKKGGGRTIKSSSSWQLDKGSTTTPTLATNAMQRRHPTDHFLKTHPAQVENHWKIGLTWPLFKVGVVWFGPAWTKHWFFGRWLIFCWFFGRVRIFVVHRFELVRSKIYIYTYIYVYWLPTNLI